MSIRDETSLPVGFTLTRELVGHDHIVNRIAWSPDGTKIASASYDGTVRVWDLNGNEAILTAPKRSQGEEAFYDVTWSPDGAVLIGCAKLGFVIAWDVNTKKLIWETRLTVGSVVGVDYSPDGHVIAAGSAGGTIYLLHPASGKSLRQLSISSFISAIEWSPDGNVLISTSSDGTLCLTEIDRSSGYRILEGHTRTVLNVDWSPVGNLFASASADQTIRIWDGKTCRQIAILEGHTSTVTAVSFSFDGRFLASQSPTDIRLWRTDTHRMVALLAAPALDQFFAGFAFNPTSLRLASTRSSDGAICIWELDADAILGQVTTSRPAQYSNAKVVLVGDSGVGKSGLALALTGEPWKPTESTHGRRVWVFNTEHVEMDNGLTQTRETLLWDLAGQPDYRLIHQLHLTEVAIALVVFDSKSQTDPFTGVHHWDRAIRQAQRVQSESIAPAQKYLVAARVDVGRIGASPDRIEWLRQDLKFNRYFETSAKEGWGIEELAAAIHEGIDWEALPTVSSTELFQNIKAFLVKEKESGRLLSSMDDLYRAYLNQNKSSDEREDLRAQFETCIGRVESRGLIQRLSFGNLILLQPELQDVYASAMANAVKDEPDGLGCIKEEKARAGQFRMPADERIKDAEQEKLLLISTVEDLLRHEIALREQGEDGQYLVFPSQLTRENPDLPDPEGKAVIFNFEGPVLNIYATLAVRLSYSGFFKKKEMWKNAATYSTTGGGTCGMFLREVNEGRGELTPFFDPATSEESRFQFEEYIRVHLERKALPESIHRRRIFVCHGCSTPVLDVAAKRRKERGFDWIACNVCEPQVRISLLDREERVKADRVATISEIDRAVETQRERQTAASVIQGKIATNDFDVFLCHNRKDKAAVKRVGELLKERGILPWLDEWELQPGMPWQPALEKQIEKIKSAAVFVGEDGIGPWQQQELDAFLREFVSRNCPVIPVLLENAPKKPTLPVFLKGMTWVDFRKPDPDPLNQLIWGITGQREFGREYERLTLLK